jgi:hypothetical protein
MRTSDKDFRSCLRVRAFEYDWGYDEALGNSIARACIYARVHAHTTQDAGMLAQMRSRRRSSAR